MSKRYKQRKPHKSNFRSGLEEAVSEQLNKLRVKFEYESIKIRYLKPQKYSSYCPDFILPNGIIIETKGRFIAADRMKHLLIKEQHPELDIRFVFGNSRNKINPSSKTTYADWAEKNGYKYADKLIPKEWLDE